jgi:hypothetical protein
LHGLELRGHLGLGIARAVDHHGKQEGFLLGHRVRALGGEFPFEPEVALKPRLCVCGNHGHEQRARGDLLADFRIPRIAAHELALIEPDFDANVSQAGANALRRRRVLRGIADENREGTG